MKLQNAKSPEMAKFLLMMLLSRSKVLEKKVQEGNCATDTIAKRRSELDCLNDYLENSDCSYLDRKETESDILSLKNEIRRLEQDEAIGERASASLRQIQRAVYKLNDIVAKFETQEKHAKIQHTR